MILSCIHKAVAAQSSTCAEWLTKSPAPSAREREHGEVESSCGEHVQNSWSCQRVLTPHNALGDLVGPPTKTQCLGIKVGNDYSYSVLHLIADSINSSAFIFWHVTVQNTAALPERGKIKTPGSMLSENLMRCCCAMSIFVASSWQRKRNRLTELQKRPVKSQR